MSRRDCTKHRVSIICLAAALLAAPSADIGFAREKPQARARKPVAEKADDGKLNYSPEAWPDAPDTADMLKRLVCGTAIVLGLCICTVFAGRRWLRGAPTRASSGQRLRLVETVALGHRCAVHLLHVGHHQVLVGVDAAGVKSLVHLPVSFEQEVENAHVPNLEIARDFETANVQIA